MNARRAVTIVTVAVLATSGMGPAQAPEREIQMGVKTTGRGWAVMADVTVSMDDLPIAGQALQGAFTKLWTDALAAGLTPLGPGHIVMLSMPMAPPTAGELSFEVQVPFIEQPTEQDLDGVGGLLIVPIEPSKVAYTYCKPSGEDPHALFADVSRSFTRLYQWIFGTGLAPTQGSRIIAYGPDEDGRFQALEVQVFIE